jgi:(1->4)-alpha-D-glucan 1-alpha-D-glucosylmutase
VKRIPVATYRLQLGRDLTLDQVTELLPYLEALGISDCYTSPILETATKNSHGYDVADHNRVREEIGGEAALARLAAGLRARGMGLLLDVVPNHMGIAGNNNAWWFDVLEKGPLSEYASFFDIDWHPVKHELRDKVLLPILGDQYGAVLDKGELQLRLTGGRFRVHYYDTVLPIALRSYARILTHRLEQLQADEQAMLQFKSLVTWFATMPGATERDPDRIVAREGDRESGHDKLAALLTESPVLRAFVDDNIRVYNGTPGDPRSFDLLDALLDEQSYRLAFWRVAGEEINYRRFFDINELAAIRMEDPQVFAATHRYLFRLVADGVVTGLRIDHPDGLYAPGEYLRRLQDGCGGDFYVVAEKILAPGEPLPETWAADGTTGYEFVNLVNGIFLDRTQARAVDQVYARLIKIRPPFVEVVYECKRLIMETAMASELNVLASRLNAISEKHRSSRDFTLRSLTAALREIIAAFPVYRTYIGDRAAESARDALVSERDREYIARACASAQRRTPTTNAIVYDWIAGVLTLRMPAWADEAARRERIDFVMRFQQITGPVTAKGYEDTAFYRFNRLLSLNEVGGDPGRFGTSLAEFHTANAARAARSPHALATTSTHDTKRSEDVRARINVLSEIPHEWRRRVLAWQKLNRRHRAIVDGVPTPGANTEYLIYQTLVGAWPISAARLGEYVMKAIHEAKSHTSWINPNKVYDDAVGRFVEAIVDPRRSAAFLDDLVAFHQRIAHFGAFNSLAQTLIKITAPGVPDFYQGTELWDLSLVDPDNRRPVDWGVRRRTLDDLTAARAAAPDPAAFAHELVKMKEDGRVKMYVTARALAVRRARAALFQQGAYRALEVTGAHADHVCAFARVHADAAVLTVVPRLLARRGADSLPVGADYWADTRVAVPAGVPAAFRNDFTGERVHGTSLAVADVLATFPVALLESEAA